MGRQGGQGVRCEACDQWYRNKIAYRGHCNRSRTHKVNMQLWMVENDKGNWKGGRKKAGDDAPVDDGRQQLLQEVQHSSQAPELPARHPPYESFDSTQQTNEDTGVPRPQDCNPDLMLPSDVDLIPLTDTLRPSQPSNTLTQRLELALALRDGGPLHSLAARLARVLLSMPKTSADAFLQIFTDPNFNPEAVPWKNSEELHAYMDETKDLRALNTEDSSPPRAPHAFSKT